MTSYLIKTILCSGLLLLFYHLFLEKEKMHGFNRWYLLISMVFSLIIPLVSIEVKEKMENVPEQLYRPIETMESVIYPQSQELVTTDTTDWTMPILLGIYMTISAILLFRLLKNIASLARGASNGKTIDYNGTRLVLLPESTATYSFFNRIFVNKQEFEQNYIEPDILQHELAHVQQWHTLDLLFIELMYAFVWFNPILIYFKKAIQMNHEFLADDAVLTNHADLKNYQLILINKALQAKSKNLTSSFNYSITKKRLAMMTKSTSTTKKLLTILLTALIFGTVLTLFTEKVHSQNVKNPPKKAGVKSNPDGVSQKHFDLYEATVDKMISTRKGKDGKEYTVYSMMDNDLVKKVDVIYRKMSDTQRAKATKLFFIPMRTPQITRPTDAQLREWLDSKKFGVWIDDKRVANNVLTKYKMSDFDYYSLSRLEKNAINYGKHYFQIDLSTPANFKVWQDSRTPLDNIPE